MTDKKDKCPLLIIDGYGFIFRAYHVQPPLTAPDGTPVGAIYGFVSMLLKLIGDFKPEHAVIVLDSAGKNFRHSLYNEYKAHRPPAPDDLIIQLKLIEKAAKALNFLCLSKEGFEADDIIATLATKATNIQSSAIVVSSDKDLMQLVNGHVGMYDPAKAKFIKEEDIIAKFGVGAAKVREVQALIGDKSDNIPGVAGIGPKTASQLIEQFGTVDGIFTNIDKVEKPRQKELLLTNKENALLSWKLVGMDHNVDINQDIENFHWNPPQQDQISNFLNEYGFKSLHKRVENIFNVKVTTDISSVSHEINTIRQTQIIEVTEENQLKPLYSNIRKYGKIAVGISQEENNNKIIIFDKHNIYLINVGSVQSEVAADLFSYNDKKSSNKNLTKQIFEIFSDSSVKKITYNLKEILRFVANQNCDNSNICSFDDLQIMEYVLNAGKKSDEKIEIHNFIDKYEELHKELFKNKSLDLYQDIDLPLCYILHDMERVGVKIDINHLQKLSKEFSEKIDELQKKIFSITGREFNIASPKQLGEILFNEMKLPFAKTSGKSKTYVTNVSILEKLQEEGFEIADLLLQYRHLTKLQNTYTDSLPKQADTNSRIHTTFLQTVTSTGRLSSINPNVQNIPTHTEEGSRIRAGFVAIEGTELISADYSQIELRILSQVANVHSLKRAFIENRDIHSETASKIFSIPLDKITPDLRYKAKAINFGIIYGISSFGLAKQLNISRAEAANHIEKYFQEYPEIRRYMDDTIMFARKNGFVANLLGRKCFLPTINDKNHTLRSFAERAAINAPMQSMASDIVKMAMIVLSEKIHEKSIETKMILQIHDELIFESPKSEVEQVSKIIKSTMENIIFFDVPLQVSISSGRDWQEIH